MSYQAVVRNSSDALITNAQVGMKISILKGSASGTVVYTETQTPTTNTNGLVSIEIGAGTIVSGNFTTINWANGPYFIKTETDPTGGTNYTITGTSQLLSVPYALHAKTAESITGTITETQNLDHVLTQGASAGNKNITNLAEPVNAQDAATKAYVDALFSRKEALEEKDLLSNGFTDSRDGTHYNAVKIGNQIWMAENLKYLPSVVDTDTGSETTPYYYVCGYNGTVVADAKATSNYTTYGVLYNWPAAMANSGSSNSNPSGVQGACPCGWHLPSDAEWSELTNYLGGTSVAGGKLKETGTTHWYNSYPGITNETGFTALPGGYRNFNGTFFSIGYGGYWWSATEDDTDNAWFRFMVYGSSSVYKSFHLKELGISVRCVRD